MGQIVGPKRVWGEFEDGPGLAMSRCFGDKNAAKFGIIAVPSSYLFKNFLLATVKIEIPNSEAIVILGSDGLFEFLTNEEVRIKQ